MKEAEKISIIVPVYNVRDYLAECLDSVLCQTHANIEVIVVDDGSTDGSSEICRQYAAKDKRVRVVTRPNGGLSAARNSGIEAARGSWLMFVDADDVIAPYAVDAMLAETAGADVVMSSFIEFSGSRLPHWHHVDLNSSRRDGLKMTGKECAQAMLYQTKMKRGVVMSACGKLFRRTFWGKTRFREGILYEDLDLIPVLVSKARAVTALRRPMYGYRMRKGSILGSEFCTRRFNALDISTHLVADFSTDEDLLTAARDRRLSVAFNMLLLMGLHGYDNPARYRECRQIIKKFRGVSLRNPKVRLRNKIGILLSYIFGVKSFKTRFFGRLFLRRH